MTAASDCDILIIGGGHSGLFLACALACRGYRVLVADPAPLFPPEGRADGRNLALLRGSRDIAERHGLWSEIAAIACPVDRVVALERPGGARVVYRASELDGLPLAYGVEHGALRRVLAAAFSRRLGPRSYRQRRLLSFTRDPETITARFEDGSEIRTRLLVGADGRGSAVRRRACIPIRRWDYGQTALTFVIEHEYPARGTIHEFLRPGGPLALLPLASHRSGVTWVVPAERARELAILPETALLARLARETEGVTGRMRLASPVSAWPLSAQYAWRHAVPRVVLVGDAAHGVHPIHAQGFNMALADIDVLVRELARAQHDPGAPDPLRAYERARSRANLARLWMTDALNRIFSSHLPLLQPLRSGAIAALDVLAPLRRRAMWHGMVLHDRAG